MRFWINDASGVAKVSSETDLFAKKGLAQKIYGSNLTLTGKIARGDAREPWAALCAAPTSRNWERVRGNRTPASSLGRTHPTIGPHPQMKKACRLFSLYYYFEIIIASGHHQDVSRMNYAWIIELIS